MQIQTVNMSDGSVAAHKAGCRDIARLRGSVEVADPAEFASQFDVWVDYNQDFLAEGSGAWDIRFLACCKDLPAGDHTMTEDGFAEFQHDAEVDAFVASNREDMSLEELATVIDRIQSEEPVTTVTRTDNTIDAVRRTHARLIPGLGLPAIKDFAAYCVSKSVEPEEFGYLFSRYSVSDFRIAIQDCGMDRKSEDFADTIAAHRYSRKNRGYDYYADRGL